MQASFVRTLRIPEDGETYPLPAGLGRLPLYRVEDYASKVPAKWLTNGGFFIPLYQREALYLDFAGVRWRPSVLKVAVGRINAVTGKPFDARIRSQSQDYVVIPDQQWLDGINKGNGIVSQFVAMPLGQGYTIEEQVTDEAVHGGFQLMGYDPYEDAFPEEDPEGRKRKEEEYKQRHLRADGALYSAPLHSAPKRSFQDSDIRYSLVSSFEMGIAAGGSIEQKIINDRHGVDSWNPETATPVFIHIVNSEAFESITGKKAPPTPITPRDYKVCGLPWFKKYEESTPGLPGAKAFRFIKSVFQIDQSRGIAGARSESGLTITPEIIRHIHVPTENERIENLQTLIKSQFETSRYEVCIRNCTALLDLVPSSSYALLMRASSYMKTGMYKLADIDASSVLDSDPGNVTAYVIRAQANISSGWLSHAACDAKAALALEPTNLHARELLKRAEEDQREQ